MNPEQTPADAGWAGQPVRLPSDAWIYNALAILIRHQSVCAWCDGFQHHLNLGAGDPTMHTAVINRDAHLYHRAALELSALRQENSSLYEENRRLWAENQELQRADATAERGRSRTRTPPAQRDDSRPPTRHSYAQPARTERYTSPIRARSQQEYRRSGTPAQRSITPSTRSAMSARSDGRRQFARPRGSRSRSPRRRSPSPRRRSPSPRRRSPSPRRRSPPRRPSPRRPRASPPRKARSPTPQRTAPRQLSERIAMPSLSERISGRGSPPASNGAVDAMDVDDAPPAQAASYDPYDQRSDDDDEQFRKLTPAQLAELDDDERRDYNKELKKHEKWMADFKRQFKNRSQWHAGLCAAQDAIDWIDVHYPNGHPDLPRISLGLSPSALLDWGRAAIPWMRERQLWEAENDGALSRWYEDCIKDAFNAPSRPQTTPWKCPQPSTAPVPAQPEKAELRDALFKHVPVLRPRDAPRDPHPLEARRKRIAHMRDALRDHRVRMRDLEDRARTALRAANKDDQGRIHGDHRRGGPPGGAGSGRGGSGPSRFPPTTQRSSSHKSNKSTERPRQQAPVLKPGMEFLRADPGDTTPLTEKSQLRQPQTAEETNRLVQEALTPGNILAYEHWKDYIRDATNKVVTGEAAEAAKRAKWQKPEWVKKYNSEKHAAHLEERRLRLEEEVRAKVQAEMQEEPAPTPLTTDGGPPPFLSSAHGLWVKYLNAHPRFAIPGVAHVRATDISGEQADHLFGFLRVMELGPLPYFGPKAREWLRGLLEAELRNSNLLTEVMSLEGSGSFPAEQEITCSSVEQFIIQLALASESHRNSKAHEISMRPVWGWARNIFLTGPDAHPVTDENLDEVFGEQVIPTSNPSPPTTTPAGPESTPMDI